MAVVLVVDDDADLLAILGEALAEEGWQVLSASYARAALSVARSSQVDVVLTDVVMPDSDGLSLERSFREDPVLKGVPFVFMTGAPWVAEASAYAHARVVAKPFEVSEVAATLRSCLAGD